MPGGTDVIFGQSSYQTRRLPRSPAFIFSTPTFSSPNSEDNSPSSSGPTTPLPLTPGTPLHPEFDFQSKHSSQEEKVQQPALVGLGMRGVFTHEEQKSMEPSMVRPPVLESQTVSTSGSTSRLFKVGRGGRAVFFDPVAPTPRTIVPKIISAPRVFTRSTSGHSISNPHSIEGDDSEEEFISHDRSPTLSPRLACEMTGPVTLKELILLRQQVQRVYEQALRGRGNGMTIKQEREKRIRRKAVPSMLVEQKRKIKEDVFSVKENTAPVIPDRTDSLPTSKPYILNAPPLPLSALSDHFSFPSQGISRARKPSSLICYSRTRSSISSTNETVASSTHGSVRSGVSTLASPLSESGSMPITPVASHASHSTAPIAIRGGNHPFFGKDNKAFELDVASMLAPDSPEFTHSAMDMEDDDDEEEELSTEAPSPSQKNFYQNQGATKSTWALFTAKLKQAGGQNKGKTELIEKTGRKLWGRQKA
jgi:hypothetical protein